MIPQDKFTGELLMSSKNAITEANMAIKTKDA